MSNNWRAKAIAARSRATETAIADLCQGDYVYPAGRATQGPGVVAWIVEADGSAAVGLVDARTLTFRPGQTVMAARP